MWTPELSGEALRLQNLAQQYEIATQLDAIRQLVYNPEWDQGREASELAQLFAEIQRIPHAILGVSLDWVRGTLMQYYLAMKDRHIWILTQRQRLISLEPVLLQQAEEGDFLADVWSFLTSTAGLELLASVFIEPIDWALTLRDLLQGNEFALIGLLPMIPGQIDNIGAAARGVGDFAFNWRFGRGAVDQPYTGGKATHPIQIYYRNASFDYADEIMVAQEFPTSCVPACSRQAFRDLGYEVTEERIREAVAWDVDFGTQFELQLEQDLQKLADEISSGAINVEIIVPANWDMKSPLERQHLERLLPSEGQVSNVKRWTSI